MPSSKSHLMYDQDAISAVLEKMLADIGQDRFSHMRLMELEKHLRDNYDPGNVLPRKTTLRAAINNFRAKKWGIEPKKSIGRFRRY